MNNIEVGKWAVYFRPNPCCGYEGSVFPARFRLPFIVTKIISLHVVCKKCNVDTVNLVAFGVDGCADDWHLVYSLKRLDDLSESTATDEQRVREIAE